MWIPGFGSEELRPYKKQATTEAHKQVVGRLDARILTRIVLVTVEINFEYVAVVSVWVSGNSYVWLF